MSKHVETRGRPRKWSGPLAEWMIASGIRPKDLAEKIDVDLSTLYRWFRGDQNPSYDTAKVIARIARRSAFGRKLTLEDITRPRRLTTNRGDQNVDGVLSRSATEARDRGLATAQK